MPYTLATPAVLIRQGKRPYLEDYVVPLVPTSQDRIFLVCDGVGGAVGGDQASRFVAENFLAEAHRILVKNTLNVSQGPTDYQQLLNAILKTVEQGMDAFLADNPTLTGMATTLTFLYFSPDGSAVLAWAGDSKIYHLRGETVNFKTTDHSLVADLIRRGEITEEEAKSHPRKNVILRAIMGSHNPSHLDTHVIEDVQVGDRFILCTDGITEGVDESTLVSIASIETNEKDPPDQKGQEVIEMIDQRCAIKSNDNYAMIYIEVMDSIKDVTTTTQQIKIKPKAPAPEPTTDLAMSPTVPEDAKAALSEPAPTAPKKPFKTIIFFLIILICAIITILIYFNLPKEAS